MGEEIRVLTEDEAIEMFAFLMTSARSQLDDPCRYASMRLLTAAEEPATVSPSGWARDPRAAAIDRRRNRLAQTHTNDLEAYIAALDGSARGPPASSSGASGRRRMADAMLELFRTRRAVRGMTDEPVAREDLERILDAGRWAPTGGNTRSVRFVAVEEPATLRLLRMASPGMLQRPAAAIVLCLDPDVLEAEGVSPTDPTPGYDIGTTLQTMLLAAHALGLGGGPVSSCSWAAVAEVLQPPAGLEPRMIVCLGHAPRPPDRCRCAPRR